MQPVTLNPYTHTITSKKGNKQRCFIVPPMLGEKDTLPHVLAYLEGGQVTKVNKNNLKKIKAA